MVSPWRYMEFYNKAVSNRSLVTDLANYSIMNNLTPLPNYIETYEKLERTHLQLIANLTPTADRARTSGLLQAYRKMARNCRFEANCFVKNESNFVFGFGRTMSVGD